MSYPPVERWEDWEEYDPVAWPQKVKRRYSLVPTICFNCEAACGLLAYVDRATFKIQKFEGNPTHPGSRGRNCAKGPATLNQVNDPERILYPLRRVGPRGGGRWERVTWDEALDRAAAGLRAATERNAGDGVGLFSCSKATNEMNFVAQKFMRTVLRSNNIDSCNRT